MSKETGLGGDPSHAITSLLAEVKKGNKAAEEKLIPLIYKELHGLGNAGF